MKKGKEQKGEKWGCYSTDQKSLTPANTIAPLAYKMPTHLKMSSCKLFNLLLFLFLLCVLSAPLLPSSLIINGARKGETWVGAFGLESDVDR